MKKKKWLVVVAIILLLLILLYFFYPGCLFHRLGSTFEGNNGKIGYCTIRGVFWEAANSEYVDSRELGDEMDSFFNSNS